MSLIEGNKDEAYHCIDIAIQALTEGKLGKAEKFLLKAEKLYPTQRAKDVLTQVKSMPNGARSGAKRETESAHSEGPRKRKNSDGRNAEPEYTTEQLEAVRKLKKCRNYYEVLGISKKSPDSEIKKAYKKLALQLHPDKNKAPGAAEAFKALGNAAAILSDGFPQQNVYMRQQRRRQQHQHRKDRENQNNSSALINLLPILLLIGLPMISSFIILDPIYSLSPSPKYPVKRETNGLKIPYYVKDNFCQEYQGSVGRLEESVEEDFINHLKHSCIRERNYRDSMLAKARIFGDRELFLKAQNMNMPSCENLQKYLNT